MYYFAERKNVARGNLTRNAVKQGPLKRPDVAIVLGVGRASNIATMMIEAILTFPFCHSA
eukprot:scaffold2400_cov187-Cylindrotheca_fusiformis.AAC.7